MTRNEQKCLAAKKRTAKYRDQGLCSKCGKKPPRPNRAQCEDCTAPKRKYYRRRREKLILAGICSCGKPLSGFTQCSDCLSSHLLVAKERRKKYLAQGLCYCGASPVAERQQCEKCWLRSLAGTHKIKVPVLETLWKSQNAVCALTGEPIIMGLNASLDHKVPTSRGGTNDIDNLQWVSKTANAIKTDLTPEELVSFCTLVLNQAGFTVFDSNQRKMEVNEFPKSSWNTHHADERARAIDSFSNSPSTTQSMEHQPRSENESHSPEDCPDTH